MDPLRAAASVAQPSIDPAGSETSVPEGRGFAELIADVLASANERQLEAERQARALAEGKGDIVETMIAISEADLAVRFVVSLRNRALEAYHEIMRLQV